MNDTGSLPYRYVDRDSYGWYLTTVQITAGRTGPMYHCNERRVGDVIGGAGLEPDVLAAERGPLRPVEPVTDADEALLTEAFTAAGRKTVATLAAAIEQTFHHLRSSAEKSGVPNGFDTAKRALTAGRAGSWESHVLVEVMLFGNGLNLVRPKGSRNPTAAVMRAAGPSRRVDRQVRGDLVEILHRWVTDPARYTEVAETLAAAVAGHADANGGWRTVADQWLQPGAGIHDRDARTCYRLFYSTSPHLDTGLL